MLLISGLSGRAQDGKGQGCLGQVASGRQETLSGMGRNRALLRVPSYPHQKPVSLTGPGPKEPSRGAQRLSLSGGERLPPPTCQQASGPLCGWRGSLLAQAAFCLEQCFPARTAALRMVTARPHIVLPSLWDKGLSGNHYSQVCPIPPDNGQACNSVQGPSGSGQRSPEICCPGNELLCFGEESPLFSLEAPACGPNYPNTPLSLGPIHPGEPAFGIGGASSYTRAFHQPPALRFSRPLGLCEQGSPQPKSTLSLPGVPRTALAMARRAGRLSESPRGPVAGRPRKGLLWESGPPGDSHQRASLLAWDGKAKQSP